MVIDSLSFIEPLASVGTNWISQTPFIWQANYAKPDMRGSLHSDRVWWGESAKGMAQTARFARERGISSMLKPHIWLRRSGDKWRSDIAMESAEEWDAWFANYKKLILEFAEFAEKEKFEAFCIGTELRLTAAHEDKWRDIIASVRTVYSGKLTYAANWYAEYEEVQFWDALDFIGIQGYFPLGDREPLTKNELIAAWQPHINAMATLAEKTGKPIVFTEIGYKNSVHTTKEPWLWPERRRYRDPNEKPHPDLNYAYQKVAFEAFFEALWDRDWFLGAYIWKWRPFRDGQSHNEKRIRFSPQNAPALDVISEWYRKN